MVWAMRVGASGLVSWTIALGIYAMTMQPDAFRDARSKDGRGILELESGEHTRAIPTDDLSVALAPRALSIFALHAMYPVYFRTCVGGAPRTWTHAIVLTFVTVLPMTVLPFLHVDSVRIVSGVWAASRATLN